MLNFQEAEEVIKQAEREVLGRISNNGNKDVADDIDLRQTVEEMASNISAGKIDRTFYEDNGGGPFGFDFSKGSIDGINDNNQSSDIVNSVTEETIKMLDNNETADGGDDTASVNTSPVIVNCKNITKRIDEKATTKATSISSDSDSNTKSERSVASAEHSGGEGDDSNENILSVSAENNDGKPVQLPKKRKIQFPESVSDSEEAAKHNTNDNNEPQLRTRPENKTKCVCKGGCRSVVSTDNTSYCEKPNRLYNAICHGDCKRVISKALMKSVGAIHHCVNVGVFKKNMTPVCTFVICQACHVKQYESETKGGRRTRRSKQ